jgi:hypothetical protein
MRELAFVVAADAFVGAGHSERLEPAGSQWRINFLPAVLATYSAHLIGAAALMKPYAGAIDAWEVTPRSA